MLTFIFTHRLPTIDVTSQFDLFLLTEHRFSVILAQLSDDLIIPSYPSHRLFGSSVLLYSSEQGPDSLFDLFPFSTSSRCFLQLASRVELETCTSKECIRPYELYLRKRVFDVGRRGRCYRKHFGRYVHSTFASTQVSTLFISRQFPGYPDRPSNLSGYRSLDSSLRTFAN